ncbi:4-hydroxythreonine-4-phosphate dehydrogenase PdxA, partial [Elioraea sp. Yellowstone]|uniref:4-hydroxythreonine-4-phosphate dehydrogenase PdxA n=1 Tax=Elioraea sp. Yellowstone TaxID=2592070 RepID=UPI001150563C
APAEPGRPDPAHGPAIIRSVERAVALARADEAAAVVTNPLAKTTLLAGGIGHAGHTSWLAELAGGGEPVMMLASPLLRVVPVTVHIPFAAVPSALTVERIVAAGRIAAAALRADFGLGRPRLAVTGLNPHAGEAGTIGREEIDVIRPAIEALRAEGLAASGPHPADSLFHARAREGYDAVLCMYHDQALIPIKTLDFAGAVNVTLGLPIVRTSPDHGTAYDIAGRGVADASSLIAAIELAAAMAARRERARAA